MDHLKSSSRCGPHQWYPYSAQGNPAKVCTLFGGPFLVTQFDLSSEDPSPVPCGQTQQEGAGLFHSASGASSTQTGISFFSDGERAILLLITDENRVRILIGSPP